MAKHKNLASKTHWFEKWRELLGRLEDHLDSGDCSPALKEDLSEFLLHSHTVGHFTGLYFKASEVWERTRNRQAVVNALGLPKQQGKRHIPWFDLGRFYLAFLTEDCDLVHHEKTFGFLPTGFLTPDDASRATRLPMDSVSALHLLAKLEGKGRSVRAIAASLRRDESLKKTLAHENSQREKDERLRIPQDHEL